MRSVRRSWWSTMGYVGLIIMSFIKLFVMPSYWQYYWIFIGIGSATVLLRLVMKPNYFEIKETKLIIIRDLFYEDVITIENIDKIELAAHPFAKSFIRLKNNQPGYEFNYFNVNDGDFNRMKESLKLVVE